MKKQELVTSWLASEKAQQQFEGWDFSYLNGKYTMEETPWSYEHWVRTSLRKDMMILDMGTGGGELLNSFQHPPQQTAVTEGWLKNYHLLKERLSPKGVQVVFVSEDDKLAFPDDMFDIVLNSHESFSVSEVNRVLKPGGLFLTQQVGDMNGLVLSSKLIPDFGKQAFTHHLSTVVEELELQGFDIIFKDEAYPNQYFYDMDALIYYVKTISWEFPNFTVKTHKKELMALYDEWQRHGVIYNQEHRFIVVARKN